MKILLLKNNRIYDYDLPQKIKDNFWITDFDDFNNQRNLINIEAVSGNWVLKSNYETHILSKNQNYDSVILNLYNFYTIKNDNEKEYYYLYCMPYSESKINKYFINSNGSITIGNSLDNGIVYAHPLIEQVHAKLIFENKKWTITDNNTRFGTFVNSKKINGTCRLVNGDVVFIAGLKIIVINNLVLINNINNAIQIKTNLLVLKNNNEFNLDKSISKEEELDLKLYSKEEYFYRSPRFIEDVLKEELIIEDPPAKIKNEEIPLILSIGPMISMGIVSLTMSFMTINNVINGESTWNRAMPSLIMSGAMFSSMLIWPLVNRVFDKKRKIKKEAERVKKYSEYINTKKEELQLLIKKQVLILRNKYLPLNECENIILRKKSNLWERGINQDDFLTLRLGIGTIPVIADIKYSKEKFTLEEDEMKKLIYSLINENNMLNNVPITTSLISKKVTSIISDNELNYAFFKGLLLQMITFHSYEFLKLVVLTDKDSHHNWDYLRNNPYVFDNNHQIRFFATDIDETKEVSLYLEKIYQDRKANIDFNYKMADNYYVIITDNYHMYRDVEIIKDILNNNDNMGFSLIIFSEKIQNLPSECRNFISVSREHSGIFESEISFGNKKEFLTEFYDDDKLKKCIDKVANIPIEINSDDKQLPNSLSFLEMYNVGKVEQLNIANRWQTNNSQKSLSVPVGIEKSGTLLKLDLHEKYHGPHGLIAGMTGSGKSEFIITYILSLAVNFSPDDVSFILIDYKGGGLAGVFENRETGIKIPHLAGTITNLDATEINRSLSSIQSELRRRQKIFNEARDKLGESTVDIYKYQKFYKEKKVDEAIPHLFIITDEFAELKQQQPDFMNELIQTARIGRSLGVHLILATQKPSGVVNDQIWSNSRFRVCLKVQEKSDSNEMIKCPDAALLKNVGRFYLQVGYNELFALGQSAWCGAQYYPKEKLKKKIDQKLVVIDNISNVVNTQEDSENMIVEESKGEEVNNVLKHIIEVSKQLSIKAKPLWLPKLPSKLYLDNIVDDFNYKEEKFVLNPLLGLYDDPNNQYQGIVTMPISKEGNMIIYGSSGSGKELLLTTMIYSLITQHSPMEINIYILDFGGGVFKAFSKSPQVGDIILDFEEEKISNLFKAINGEINKRKKLFAQYNGDYNGYIHNSGKTLPYILLIINNFDAFIDAYDYNDLINQISRECYKYGIIIILSVNNTNSIRYRLKQNFRENFVLQLNNRDDYTSILGNVHGMYPNNFYGRGLVRSNGIYEFQSAYVVDKEKMNDYISNLCLTLLKKYPNKANSIPVLPSIVNVYDYLNKVNSLKEVPIGISKEYIDVEYYDFYSNYATLIMSQDLENMVNFVDALIQLIKGIKNNNYLIFDSSNMLKTENAENVILANNNSKINELFIKLKEDINYQYDIYKKNNEDITKLSNYSHLTIVIYDYDKFISKLGLDLKKQFEEIILMAKELTTFTFILVDVPGNMKKYEYDSWYKNAINNNYGIWVGSSITEQTTIKTNIPYNSNLKDISDKYGIVVKKNKPLLIKLIEKGVEIV